MLEKLTGSIFEPFKEDEMTELFKITGGYCANTYGSNGNCNIPCDSITDAHTKDQRWTTVDGKKPIDADLEKPNCPSGPGTGQGGFKGPIIQLYGDLGNGLQVFSAELIDESITPW